jgi:hypothetical protein
MTLETAVVYRLRLKPSSQRSKLCPPWHAAAAAAGLTASALSVRKRL